MNEVSTRARRHLKTREAILDAARQILYEEGVGGLSLRAIARRIDYSPAGLYDYFGSKEEIIAAVCEEGFRRFVLHLRATDTALSPLDALLELGLRYYDFATHNPDYFLLMFTSGPLAGAIAPPPGVPLEAVLRSSPSFMELFRAVERCEQAGDLPLQEGQTTFARALMFWQLVHGISMLGITAGRPFPLYAESVRPALQALARGLQAQAA